MTNRHRLEWALAGAAVAGILTGLGCGGGGAEEAARVKAAPFTEPAMSSVAAEPSASSSTKMSCTPAMKGMAP